jgi:hypothetical protein
MGFIITFSDHEYHLRTVFLQMLPQNFARLNLGQPKEPHNLPVTTCLAYVSHTLTHPMSCTAQPRRLTGSGKNQYILLNVCSIVNVFSCLCTLSSIMWWLEGRGSYKTMFLTLSKSCMYCRTKIRFILIRKTWTFLIFRFVFGYDGTGTCASSATRWRVFSEFSHAIVDDLTMKVACAAGKDALAHLVLNLINGHCPPIATVRNFSHNLYTLVMSSHE